MWGLAVVGRCRDWLRRTERVSAFTASARRSSPGVHTDKAKSQGVQGIPNLRAVVKLKMATVAGAASAADKKEGVEMSSASADEHSPVSSASVKGSVDG